MKLEIPKFATDKELFTYLKENREELIFQKMAQFKKADGFSAPVLSQIPINGVTIKSDGNEPNSIKVRSIINTTYIMDSHKDVHIDGLWKKSLSENKRIKHLQEHDMSFKSVIADKDDLKAYTKSYSWRDLGYDVDGKTEALVFDSVIKQKRNPTMYDEYKDGNVDNHSVGMYYVKVALAYDSADEDDKQEKAEFDKHIDRIANKEEVKRNKYFFAVYEAKAIEGSAVPMGSNPITPTLGVKSEQFEKSEAELKAEAIKKWIAK